MAVHVGARLPQSCTDTFLSWKSKCINQQPPVSGVGASAAPGAMVDAESALRTSFSRFHPSPKKSLNAKPHLPSRPNSSPSPLPSSAPRFPINVEIVSKQLSVIPQFYFFGTHQTLRVRFEIRYRAFARSSLSLEKRGREEREIISSLKYSAYISDVWIQGRATNYAKCSRSHFLLLQAHNHEQQRTAEPLKAPPVPLVFVYMSSRPVQVGNYFPFDDLFPLICTQQGFFFFPARHKAAHMIDNACVFG